MIAKDSIHMVNLDSSQPFKKKNLQNTLMVVMYTVEVFFLNMPSSCTFVMFNLGETSVKDLIYVIQKFVNCFKWASSFAKFHSVSEEHCPHQVLLVVIKLP